MFTLNCRGRLVSIEKPVVMGIINIAPDSFSPGSRLMEPSLLLDRAAGMIADGATFVDIGAQSTRPGSELLSASQELDRIMPCIESLHAAYPDLLISVDTFYASVAKETVYAGASMVNDVSGGSMDDDMIETVGALNVPYVCMHMKGTPQTMNSLAQYKDVTVEVLDYFIHKLEQCQNAGIKDIVIDPGFGFAKTIAHNFTLLKNLHAFTLLGRPLLAGLSRKSTVYKTLGIKSEDALNGTTVLNTIALQAGASILRVHDVKEAVQAIQLLEAYKK